MGRRKKGIPLHGWLIIDKPLDMSSSQVVGKARWLTKAQKAGHGGTLDPKASGVLPLAFGEATKTVPYVMDGEKTYEFQVTWGQARSTDDAEGEIIAESDHRPSAEDITGVLKDFIGPIDQIPPKYSALKIDGQRAYKLARDDQDIEMKARRVEIHSLKHLSSPDSHRANFEVCCGKGTYVRAIGRDFGEKLGCYGYISELRRTKVGPFSLSDAISLDKLEDIVHSGALSTYLKSLQTVLDDIPALALKPEDAARLRQGLPLPIDAFRSTLEQADQTDVVLGVLDDQAVALTRLEDGWIRPFRVFNL